MSALTERTVGTHIISWRNWGTLLSNKRCGGHILSLKDLEPQVEDEPIKEISKKMKNFTQ